MSTDFVGDYNLVSSENFDDFLKALGVGVILRKTAGALKPSFHVTKDGDFFNFKSVSTFKTTEFKFKLGEEFEEKRLDGVVCKTVITQDGNKLIQEQHSDPPARIVREFLGDELKIINQSALDQIQRVEDSTLPSYFTSGFARAKMLSQPGFTKKFQSNSNWIKQINSISHKGFHNLI